MDSLMESFVNNKCFVRLKRMAVQEIKKYDKYYSQPEMRPQITELELKNEDINQLQFMGYLGLVLKHDLNESTETLGQHFSNPSISRIGSQSPNQTNEVVLIKTSIIKIPNRKPIPKTNKRKLLSKRVNKKQKTNQLFKQSVDLKKKITSLITKFPITSVMSNRLFRTFEDQLNLSNQKTSVLDSIGSPLFDNNNKPLSSRIPEDFNRWNTFNVERVAKTNELSTKLSPSTHDYTFTRCQRLEKQIRQKSGLNWKSRIKLWNCKQLSVKPLVEKENHFFSDICEKPNQSFTSFKIKNKILFENDIEDRKLGQISIKREIKVSENHSYLIENMKRAAVVKLEMDLICPKVGRKRRNCKQL